MIGYVVKGLMLILLMPAVAAAHTGVGEASGFLHGLSHPLIGSDHLLAMVAVGLWASTMGGRSLWRVPSVFVAAMIAGGVLALAGVAIPFVEQGILLSILVFGFLVAGVMRFQAGGTLAVVAFFALFHGAAHGSEIPTAVGATAYVAGFAVSTLLLCSFGVASGLMLKSVCGGKLRAALGGLVVAVGVALSLA